MFCGDLRILVADKIYSLAFECQLYISENAHVDHRLKIAAGSHFLFGDEFVELSIFLLV